MEGIHFVKELAPVCDAKSKIDFCPDVAFVMDPIRPDVRDIVPALPSGQNVKLVGFNVNGLVYNGGYNRQDMFGLRGDYKILVHDLALRVLETTDAHLLMVPHNFTAPGRVESDPEACIEVARSLQDRFEGRIHIVSSEYGAQEIKGIIGMCDFFIGSRMHSCIAALSQRIPTVGIAYSQKFRGVFDSVGFGRMVMDARHMEPYEIINRIMEIYANDVNEVASLQANVREVKGKIREVFNRLCRDTGSM
jgi:polysaccharide pyruvyl transferase WcaK-like protein